MQEFKFRLAQQKDRKELEEFLVFNNGEENRQLARDYIDCMFSENYRRPIFILICNQSGKIIGGAAVSEEFFTVDVWGISWVSVHPAYRNKGLGQKLMEHCMQEISNRAGKTVSVILATYPNKTRLYERLSFVKAGQDHEGGYFMTKILPFNP